MTNSAKLQQVTDGGLYSAGPVFCRNDHKIDFFSKTLQRNDLPTRKLRERALHVESFCGD